MDFQWVVGDGEFGKVVGVGEDFDCDVFVGDVFGQDFVDLLLYDVLRGYFVDV